MKTKIICTLGPATDDVSLLGEMLMAGMDVARINFSHGTYEETLKRLALLHQAEALTGRKCVLLADTKGPEMRVGSFRGGAVTLETGQEFVLTTEDCLGDYKHAHVNYNNLPGDVKEGSEILLADGALSLKVMKIKDKEILTTVTHGGRLTDRKRVACPGLELQLPFLSEQDRKDLHFAMEQKFAYVAASFVQREKNVQAIREVLGEDSPVKIIAKIENGAGVEHLEEIVAAADGIMVARGDLGVELPLEKLPIIQKRILWQCRKKNKIGVVATQMLESMCTSFRPTRAEVSDVSTAVFEEADMVMLSGETATGQYPLEAVETMAKVIMEVEHSPEYREQVIMHALHKTE